MSELKLYKATVWTRDLDPFAEEAVWEVLVIAWDYKGAERLALEYFEQCFDEVMVDEVNIEPFSGPKVIGVVSKPC
ncbi:hypothetical protein TK0577 [Thermococcus kodakarensis KOD1]|uniref:Uncharacterized protein n=1 Tax=Thermococcus kodakarensis (strain ATCC BAA-918 / JCM 12380 / KOD1) TaxID=69014 RepID=Q5JF54_THEKO|nr:hypothetical protein [Thermococcus kodakarensis]WCN28623.1 hypothetical protein POG15_02960 [Thermococcus kodakarensis]WCN30921.1 hypothetical protein POG21_02960 [Thermococcus kodakarensis]BAD84766.1 hypothetical protein TK0577 [Thermococcus kodakarensis KOD1]